MIFDQARRLIASRGKPRGTETIALADALGRVAAETVHAAEDLVPFPRSAMDGFAVAAGDLRDGEPPQELPLSGAVFAGDALAVHRSGTATAVATGAPLPLGADAVVPIEDVLSKDRSIVIKGPVARGDHVFPPGEDARRGDVLAFRGDRLNAARLALLAAAGTSSLLVFERPRVGLLCTGEELVDVWQTPRYGQIRNSNATLIASIVTSSGARLVSCGRCGDDPTDLRSALERALGNVDLLVTTGGASAGPRDRVKEALTDLGARFLFQSVALRPGRPTGFAEIGPVFVAVLPGNPAAAFVAFSQLVAPLLSRLAGAAPREHTVAATLRGRIVGKADRHYFVFAKLRQRDGALAVEPLPDQCSALVATAARANCLVSVPPAARLYESGDVVLVEVLDWEDVAFDDVGRADAELFDAPTPELQER
ncbi:MAG: molybdopterin molybdotransferase MoeA [Candidatus Eremiobacteraeota bacterium]|nr:molybdopterin molybdotransferase MoeA [Candidatus Eremiobacteraeota bacterium]MBC5827796.1 molybdopterin molybdotransferase MoeA [Candidatus Eremiobacteraeota bacterium]